MPYIGNGTDSNPFRPLGSDDQSGWGAIDLRPDSTKQAGFALVAFPAAVSHGDKLSDEGKGRMPAAVKRALGNRLGLTLEKDQFDEAVYELLVFHADPQGKDRWKPLVPELGGKQRIYLGGLLYEKQLSTGPGATITDNFNRADNTDVSAGAPFPWTEFVPGNWSIVSNKLQQVSSTAPTVIRADSDLATANHYAQALVAINSNSRAGGTAVRFSASDVTCYYGTWLYNVTNPIARLQKFVASTSTILSSHNGTLSLGPHTIRTEINGSSLSVSRDGVIVGSITDTAITEGLRTGIAFATSGGSSRSYDDFEAGDFGPAPVSDTLAVSVTETAEVKALLAIADTLGISLTEAASVFYGDSEGNIRLRDEPQGRVKVWSE